MRSLNENLSNLRRIKKIPNRNRLRKRQIQPKKKKKIKRLKKRKMKMRKSLHQRNILSLLILSYLDWIRIRKMILRIKSKMIKRMKNLKRSKKNNHNTILTSKSLIQTILNREI